MQFILCEWQTALAPSLAESANDVRIGRYLRDGFPYPYTVEDALRFIGASLHDAGLSRAIVIDGRAVGAVSLTKMSNVYQKNAELGYWLTPACWGKGIMSEAVRMLCREGFSRCAIERIYAEPFADNLASRRVLEKCGFTLEGVLRKSIFKAGTYHDSCVYALLRDPSADNGAAYEDRGGK